MTKGRTKRKASSAFKSAGNAWREHIKQTMAKNPEMKFGTPLLKLASKTYKKGTRTLRDAKYSVRVRPRTTGNSRKKNTGKKKRKKNRTRRR